MTEVLLAKNAVWLSAAAPRSQSGPADTQSVWGNRYLELGCGGICMENKQQLCNDCKLFGIASIATKKNGFAFDDTEKENASVIFISRQEE